MNLRSLTVLALLALPAWADEKPKAAEKPKSEEAPKVEVSGYGQLDYRRGDTGSLKTAPAHEFNGRRVRLGVGGKVNDRFSYAFTVQGDGLNANTASVLDASVTARLASWLRVQAGQFKYDFDMAGRDSASLLTLSDRTYATQVVAGGLNGASTPASPSGSFRDRGVSAFGDRLGGRVAYSLGVYQGNARASDNNSSFAWVARGQASPVKGLRLSAGFLDSNTADQGKPERGRYRAWTFGAVFERQRLFVRGEYYGARRERGAAREKPDGFYLEAAQGVAKAFEALLRYQRLDDPAVTTAGAISSVDLGGRYWIARRGARGGSSLLANVLLRDAPSGPVKGLTALNDGRGASVAAGGDLKAVFVLRLQVQF